MDNLHSSVEKKLLRVGKYFKHLGGECTFFSFLEKADEPIGFVLTFLYLMVTLSPVKSLVKIVSLYCALR